MDATRARRTRDAIRTRWYAGFRQRRFSRHMGFFVEPVAAHRSEARPVRPLTLGA